MVDWGVAMPVGCITAGPKSVALTMDAVSLRHAPLPISHHFHGCTALLRFVKWRYIKYQGFFYYVNAHLTDNSNSAWVRTL